MEINLCKLELENIKLNARDSEKIRGYIANKYENLDILHNHKEDKFIYRYPKVQYKVIRNKPIIIGIEEGAKVISNIGINEDTFHIGDKIINSYANKISMCKEKFGCTDDYIKYKFVTPWIALNQKNILKYRNKNSIEQEEMLKKILIGNILSISKSLGYTVDKELKCWIDLNQKKANLKGVSHVAFDGIFKINFFIPSYLGIGKSVSKGFGTVKKI